MTTSSPTDTPPSVIPFARRHESTGSARTASARRSGHVDEPAGPVDPYLVSLDDQGNDAFADLTVVRDWPERAAIVVGAAPHPSVLHALDAIGVTPHLASRDQAASVAAQVAPYAFLVLCPDALADDAAVEQVRAWHRRSPSARIKLAYPGSDHDPDVLLRAIRAGVTDVMDPCDAQAFTAGLRAGMSRAGIARERVLAIGAHPDDVEIGCGATLLDHRMRGDRISILTLSRGAVGGDQRARLREAGDAADVIGAQLFMADLPDTRIDDGIETIKLIERVVAMLDPTVVYVHSAHDNHQDHRAISTAVRSATRGVRRVFAYQSPSATNDFRPTQFVRVDQTIERKVDLLQVFASQDGRSYLEPELVTAGARYWARHLGANARYAEPFEVIRSVGELRRTADAPDLGAIPTPASGAQLVALPSIAAAATP